MQERRTVTVYLALGGNMGDRESILREAVALLAEKAGRVTRVSSLVETRPVGFESSALFLNGALSLETTLSPKDLLAVTQGIERQLGRTQKSVSGRYSDRPIDIDVILYGDEVVRDPDLVIPHPIFRERLFVLKPLSEIAPEAVDPVTGKTIRELLWDAS